MRLYLVRHATAVLRGTPGFPKDSRRPLTEEGRDEARRAAAALRRMKISLDAVVSSPYLRAMQTAEILAREVEFREPIQELDALRAEVEPRETSISLKLLADRDEVALVGHEPHLSAWIAELVAEQGMRCVMKKGGIACIEIEQVPPPTGSGTLRWLLTPKQLALMAGRAAQAAA